MEYRTMGTLRVPVLSLGTGTFGGAGPLFAHWGHADVREARRLIDVSLDAGVTMFDSADVYSSGASEEVLGAAIEGRRDRVLVSTKLGLPLGDGPDDAGTSGARIVRGTESALRRLKTDYIDLLSLHAFDATAPIDDVLGAFETLVKSGKVRHAGVSNFSGWQLQKSLDVATQRGFPRYVGHQVYYSLLNRDYEYELMPLALEENVGAAIWSPLGWGRLTGKLRRGAPPPEGSRLHATADFGPPVDDEHLFRVLDVLDAIAKETEKSVPQIAINWLTQRPSVATVIIGARNEKQLVDNLGAVGWTLTPAQIARLDEASATTPPYPRFPYHRQGGFRRLDPPRV